MKIVDFSHVFSAPFIWTDIKGTKRHSIRPIRLSKKEKKEMQNSYPSKFKGCFCEYDSYPVFPYMYCVLCIRNYAYLQYLENCTSLICRK